MRVLTSVALRLTDALFFCYQRITEDNVRRIKQILYCQFQRILCIIHTSIFQTVLHGTLMILEVS